MVFFRCGGPQRPHLGSSPERSSRQVPGWASKGASEERRKGREAKQNCPDKHE